jgi:hypothetical protein
MQELQPGVRLVDRGSGVGMVSSGVTRALGLSQFAGQALWQASLVGVLGLGVEMVTTMGRQQLKM